MTEDLNSIIRRLRALSGIILFIYAITHLINHSLNVYSIELADFVREHYWQPIWKNSLGTFLLYGSLIVHIPIGFYSIASKKSFRLTAREWVQLTFPVLALLLLLQHILGGYILNRMFESNFGYQALFSSILSEPAEATIGTILFTLMVIFIWTHGVIGINQLLKFNFQNYDKFKLGLNVIYYAVPSLALAGLWAGLKEQSLLAQFKAIQGEEGFLMTVLGKIIPAEAFPYLLPIEPLVMNNYPLVVLALIILTTMNVLRSKYIGNIKISYPEGREVTVAKGTSILEASRLAKIPHQSVCGGKARCTTCRVRVISHDGNLPNPNAYETMAIKKGGLEDGVRLACQLHPAGNIKIMPLVNPINVLERNSSLDGLSKPKALSGKELETVILFIDLREFTKLSEKKLPYDIVYILNRYYATCGEIIERNGGRLDKFIGDGIMAIFDNNSSAHTIYNASLKSASEISKRMKALNSELSEDLSEKLKFGMGIHAGDTIVGLMGYGETFSETAVGDNVNIASRLEELTKAYKAELVVSKYVVDSAAINVDNFSMDSVSIRGKDEKVDIYTINDASRIFA